MLLLDEPANHLDMMAIGLMEPALVNCSDEVVISRGQFSLDKVATGLPTFDGRHDTVSSSATCSGEASMEQLVPRGSHVMYT
jgi:ATPase subunit of ABC transporter with duplicated ATPase domains